MIPHDPQINDSDTLARTLGRVSFSRSCLDMGWQWETQAASRYEADRFDGWLIRCSFQRPERDTGKIGRGFGRWWYVERGATVSSMVKTMFAAAKMIVEHELLEAFKFDDGRPFDPHRTVQQLAAMETP